VVLNNNKPIWELQIRVVQSYGPNRGKEAWSTLSKGPGYGEDAIDWLRLNPWATGLVNMNLVIHSPE
jgi:hypothetical protein